jgi:hypothetical protein
VRNNLFECDATSFCDGIYLWGAKKGVVVTNNTVRTFAASSACVRSDTKAFHIYARYSVSDVVVANNRFEAASRGTCAAFGCMFEQYHSDPIANVTLYSNTCSARWSDSNATIPSSSVVVAANVLADNITLINNTLATSQVHIQTNVAQVDSGSLFRVLDGAVGVRPARLSSGCPNHTLVHVDARFESDDERRRLEPLPWLSNGCSARLNFTNADGANVFAATLVLAAAPFDAPIADVTIYVHDINDTAVASALLPSASDGNGSSVSVIVPVVVARGADVLRNAPLRLRASDELIAAYELWSGDATRLCVGRTRIDVCPSFTSAPATRATRTDLSTTTLAVMTTANDNNSDGVLIGTIIGGIIGGLLFAALIGGIYWFATERHDRQKRDSHVVEIPEFRSARGDGDSFRSVTSGGGSLASAPPMPGSVVTDYTNIPEALMQADDDYGVGELEDVSRL